MLGDFACFPNTRRAPVTAMELFVGEPLGYDPKTRVPGPVTRANLAHLEVYFATEGARLKAWDDSAAGRTQSLGGIDDPRAKARVTFVIPMDMADALGCAP